MNFKVGDKVAYHPYGLDELSEGEYVIEKDYGTDEGAVIAMGKVFFIGNQDSFVDMVGEHFLKRIED